MKRIIDKKAFGPWAIVTGASSGIGEGFARQLATDGFNLVLVARRIALLDKIGNELQREFGIKFRSVEADLEEVIAPQKIIKAAEDLDVGLLISNAGTGKVSRFLNMEEHHHKSFIQLNALSHMSLAHHFGRQFAKRKKSGILFTGAMGAYDGVPFMASMASSKAFLLSLGKSLHHEFRNSGIHITVLIASPTRTPIVAKLGFDKGMPMRPLSVEQCVEEALVALKNNRASIMPGSAYRFMNRMVPGALKRKMTGDILQKNNNII